MPEEKKSTSIEVKRVEPQEGIFFAYANQIEVGHTAFDLRIAFGELLGIVDGKLTLEQRVQVTLPWLQAKLLARLLTKVVAKFEEVNGPIKLPKMVDLSEPFDPEKEVSS